MQSGKSSQEEEAARKSVTLRLADVLREVDSQPVIRVGNTGTGTTSNSEATPAPVYRSGPEYHFE